MPKTVLALILKHCFKENARIKTRIILFSFVVPQIGIMKHAHFVYKRAQNHHALRKDPFALIPYTIVLSFLKIESRVYKFTGAMNVASKGLWDKRITLTLERKMRVDSTQKNNRSDHSNRKYHWNRCSLRDIFSRFSGQGGGEQNIIRIFQNDLNFKKSGGLRSFGRRSC